MKFTRTLFTLAVGTMTSSAFQVGPARSAASRIASQSASSSASSFAVTANSAGKLSSPSATSTARFMSSTASEIEGLIKSEIESNDVVVFSKSRCPFCAMTKALFTDLVGADNFRVIELDQRPDGGDIQKQLLAMTGQRTVPNVFVKGQHVGGNDDTQAAAGTGELQKMIGI